MYVVFYAVYANRKEIIIYECCVFIQNMPPGRR